MAKFNWNDYEEVKPGVSPASGGFNWDDHPIVPQADPRTSQVTAATTGMIQGAIPFAAPIAGAGKAIMNAVTGVSGPLAGGSMSDVLDDYRSGRDQFQGDARVAADANPKTAFAGNIAGGFANPLFKDAHSLPKIVAASAAQGLGTSDADLTKGEFGQAAKDSALSGAGGVLGYGVGKVVPKIWDGAKYFGKKALTTLGPSEEAINARLAGGAQDNAKNYSQLADDMSGTLKNLKDQIFQKSAEAKATLSSEPTIPKPYVTSTLDESLKNIGLAGNLIGPTDKEAASVLTSLKDDIDKLGSNISERDLKSIIQKMDDNINWQDQSKEKINNILKGIRSKFDSTLKFQNKSYEKAMEPVAERVGLLNDLEDRFNFKNVPGKGLKPTDTTATKLQTSLRDNKAVTQDALENLNNLTGKDYSEMAKDYQLATQFAKGDNAKTARRALIGGALGGALGHSAIPGLGGWGGTALGSVVGGTLDKYGGQALGKMIDGYVRAGNSQVFGKFAPALEKAAAQGPQALAVMGSILGSNPEFKKLVQKLGPDTPEGLTPVRKLGSVGGNNE
jgi:hypothetical protein